MFISTLSRSTVGSHPSLIHMNGTCWKEGRCKEEIVADLKKKCTGGKGEELKRGQNRERGKMHVNKEGDDAGSEIYFHTIEYPKLFLYITAILIGCIKFNGLVIFINYNKQFI